MKNWMRADRLGISNSKAKGFSKVLLGTAVISIIGSIIAESWGEEWEPAITEVAEDGHEIVSGIYSTPKENKSFEQV